MTSQKFKMAALEKFRDEDRGYSEVHKVIKGSYNCYMLTCISYVRFSQAAEGTIKTLREVLFDMRRGDVLDILEGRHDSGFDSGFGSQSLSFNKSEGNVCTVPPSIWNYKTSFLDLWVCYNNSPIANY